MSIGSKYYGAIKSTRSRWPKCPQANELHRQNRFSSEWSLPRTQTFRRNAGLWCHIETCQTVELQSEIPSVSKWWVRWASACDHRHLTTRFRFFLGLPETKARWRTSRTNSSRSSRSLRTRLVLSKVRWKPQVSRGFVPNLSQKNASHK